jgi:transketolase
LAEVGEAAGVNNVGVSGGPILNQVSMAIAKLALARSALAAGISSLEDWCVVISGEGRETEGRGHSASRIASLRRLQNPHQW